MLNPQSLNNKHKKCYLGVCYYKMYVLNFNPTILKLGFLEIRWYSLIYALGFILSYLYFRYYAMKKIDNFDEKKLEIFIIYSIIGVVAGARVFYFLFYNVSELFSLEVFKIWNAGLSFHGGLIGVVISTILFSKKHKVDLWKLFDASVVVAIFALMIGRIGNLINGELAGTVFNGPWCAVFPLYDNLCRHPYPVYGFVSHLLLFVYLVVLIYLNKEKLKEFIGSRILSVNFLIGYGVLRIITDIWKMDGIFLFMKTGQWLSVVMILIGVWLLVKKK